MIQEDLPFEEGRVCSKCKQWKHWRFFNRNTTNSKSGYKASCRDCDNVYKRRYENTPEGMYTTYKRGAITRNHYVWDISLEEFRERVLMPCAYCGKESEPEVNLNGLDRVYNDIPYMIDNVVSCCGTCNFSKGTLDFNEYLEHCTKVHLNSIKKKNKSIKDKRITYEKSNGEWTKVYIKDSEVGEISKENFIDPIW